MPNIWSKQAYVQGFDCRSISFKEAVNIFELMKIVEFIYEDVVEPSYKKHTREDVNHAVHRRNKGGELALSKTHTETEENTGKRRK